VFSTFVNSMAMFYLNPFFIKKIFEVTQQMETVQSNFLFQSLHNGEVMLWRRILVGPFPNNISNTSSYSWWNRLIDCIIGTGPTLTYSYPEYIWSDSEEGNGPNKFLIRSTCTVMKSCTVNEEFLDRLFSESLESHNPSDVVDMGRSIDQPNTYFPFWFLLPYNNIKIKKPENPPKYVTDHVFYC